MAVARKRTRATAGTGGLQPGLSPALSTKERMNH